VKQRAAARCALHERLKKLQDARQQVRIGIARYKKPANRAHCA
jgi:hypothetical protein